MSSINLKTMMTMGMKITVRKSKKVLKRELLESLRKVTSWNRRKTKVSIHSK